jgi:hypothetical protein
MTRNLLVALSLFALLVMVSCSGTTTPVTSSIDQTPDLNRYSDWHFGDDLVLTIIAGQNYEVGTVTVSNDYANIYFEIALDDGWTMSETHLHVADDYGGFPQTKKGTPIPGQFDYSMTFDPYVNGYTWEVPLGDWEAGDTVAFALHLVVWANGGSETGWAGCYEFEGNRWGYWCDYEIGECEIDLPGCLDDYQAKYFYPGTLGYWDVELYNVPEGFDVYDGMWPAWCIQKYVYAYPNTLYDICLISTYWDELPPAAQDINWEAVAWILNHKNPDATNMDIQHAIWHFTDGFNPTDPEAIAMIQDADANSAGYYPGPGELMAVIVYVADNVQMIFIEVEIGCV